MPANTTDDYVWLYPVICTSTTQRFFKTEFNKGKVFTTRPRCWNDRRKVAYFKGMKGADSSFVRQYERKRTVGRPGRRWKDEEWLLCILDNEDNGMWSGLEWLRISECSLRSTQWTVTYIDCVGMAFVSTSVTWPCLRHRKVQSPYERISDVWLTVHRNSVWIRKTN